MANDNTVLGIVALVGIVALASIVIIFLSRSSSGGTIAVLDGQGNPLYTIIDKPGTGNVQIIGRAPFEPVTGTNY